MRRLAHEASGVGRQPDEAVRHVPQHAQLCGCVSTQRSQEKQQSHTARTEKEVVYREQKKRGPLESGRQQQSRRRRAGRAGGSDTFARDNCLGADPPNLHDRADGCVQSVDLSVEVITVEA